MDDYLFTKQLLLTYTTTHLELGSYRTATTTMRFNSRNSAKDNAQLLLASLASSINVDPKSIIILSSIEMTCIKTLV